MKKEENGDIVVNDILIGTISGFQFHKHEAADEALFDSDAEEFIVNTLEHSIDEMISAGDAALRIENDFTIRYHGHAIASLKKTDNFFSPDLDILVDDRVQGLPLARLALHVQSRLKRQINLALDPLELLRKIDEPSDAVKEFVELMINSMGCLNRRQAEPIIKKLSTEDKAKLRKLGVRFAQYSVFLRDILKPLAQETKLILWALSEGFDTIPEAPPAGVVSLPYDATLPKGYYDVTGYRACNEYVIRADMIEKLADTLRPLAQKTASNPEGHFEITPQHMSLIGKSGDVFEAVLKHLGYDFIVKEVTVTSFAPAEQKEAETGSEETIQNVATDVIEASTQEEVPQSEENNSSPENEVSTESDTPQESSNVDVSDTIVEKKIWFWKGFKMPERTAKPFMRRDKKQNNDENGEAAPKFKKPFVKKDGHKNKDSRFKGDSSSRKPKKQEPSPYVNMPGKHKVAQENNPFAILAGLRKE